MKSVTLDEIYAKHKRDTEVKNIPIERYAVDGKPTCCAWSGAGNKQRMVCTFLLLDSSKYPQDVPLCMATGESVINYQESKYRGFLKPNELCLLWKDGGSN